MWAGPTSRECPILKASLIQKCPPPKNNKNVFGDLRQVPVEREALKAARIFFQNTAPFSMIMVLICIHIFGL